MKSGDVKKTIKEELDILKSKVRVLFGLPEMFLDPYQ